MPHAHFALPRAQKQWDVFTSRAMHHAACQFERAAARGGAADDTPLVLAPRANPRALALLLVSPGASPDASRVHTRLHPV